MTRPMTLARGSQLSRALATPRARRRRRVLPPARYTVTFPSTAAAVATDTVQLLVFDVPSGRRATGLLPDAHPGAQAQGRRRSRSLQNAPVNICEMLGGRKPITIPYGEKAVLAVAQRKAEDFISGCVIQTFGDGDAPLDIDLALVDVSNAVPDTTCATSATSAPAKCPAL